MRPEMATLLLSRGASATALNVSACGRCDLAIAAPACAHRCARCPSRSPQSEGLTTMHDWAWGVFSMMGGDADYPALDAAGCARAAATASALLTAGAPLWVSVAEDFEGWDLLEGPPLRWLADALARSDAVLPALGKPRLTPPQRALVVGLINHARAVSAWQRRGPFMLLRKVALARMFARAQIRQWALWVCARNRARRARLAARAARVAAAGGPGV